jgi:flagellar secretion chaperone FliS
MSPMQKRGVSQYGKVAVGTEASFASPHRLIQMLMEGALDKIAFARGQIERREIAEKGRNITWAISIIQGLSESLDLEEGGEIAANLEGLYDYMVRCLLIANKDNDISKLDEVASLLKEVKSAWDAMPSELKQVAQRSVATSVG